MKQVGQVISENCQGRRSSRQGVRARLSEQLVSQLFVRMQSIYGGLWSARFSGDRLLEAAKAEWALELANRDEETLARAVEACKRQFDRPPTLPEFSRLCRPVEAAHRPFVFALPGPRNPEVARAGLAEVRAKLGW